MAPIHKRPRAHTSASSTSTVGHKHVHKRKNKHVKKHHKVAKTHEMLGHVGGTESSHRSSTHKKNKIKGLMKMLLPMQIREQNNAGRQVSNPETQSAGIIQISCADNDLNAIFGNINGNITDSTGGTVNPLVADDQRFYLQSTTGTSLITNSSDFAIELDIYELIPRKDSAQDPLYCWATGLTNIQAGVTTGLSPTNVGSKPTSSPMFNHFWKIDAVYHVNFAGGGVHKHIFSHNYNKPVSREMHISPNSYYKGFTKVMMYVVKGYPVHSSVDSTKVDLSDTAIDVMTYWTYKYRYMLPIKTKMAFTDIVTPITNANQVFPNQFISKITTGDPLAL